MNIPLQNFEQHIDETILNRGLQYFKKGLVDEPEETSPGVYETTVEGSELYKVRFTIKNNIITKLACTCPFDMGPVCKHEAAVIFYLQQNELDLNNVATGKTSGSKKSPKKKTPAGEVNELLNKMSHSELKDYVKDLFANNHTLRELFLAKYAILITPVSKELYTRQIKAILKTAIGRKGYIEYSGAQAVGYNINGFTDEAMYMVENNNYQNALYISLAVTEEMTAALSYADDSGGEIGGCIESAMDVMYQLTQKELPEPIRLELFNYCIQAFKKEIFEGWDWHFFMLKIAVDLVKSTDEATQIHSLLDKIKPSDQKWDFDYKNAQNLRHKLIIKTKGKAQADQFMEQNLGNSDFRKTAIEQAIKSKNYERAITLAEEGIKTDEKDKPGLADDWRSFLLKIYSLKKDTENIIKYARYLFLYSIHEKKGYFDTLKKHVSPQNWNGFVQDLISEIIKKDRWAHSGIISQIYIWEERWSDLLNIVKQSPTLHTLETYEKYLAKDFANVLTDLYQNAILEYMKNHVNRDYYIEVCRYLRRMNKLGGADKANYVIKMLQTLYPNRKALIEELKNV